jgi:hypothetical protein
MIRIDVGRAGTSRPDQVALLALANVTALTHRRIEIDPAPHKFPVSQTTFGTGAAARLAVKNSVSLATAGVTYSSLS